MRRCWKIRNFKQDGTLSTFWGKVSTLLHQIRYVLYDYNKSWYFRILSIFENFETKQSEIIVGIHANARFH